MTPTPDNTLDIPFRWIVFGALYIAVAVQITGTNDALRIVPKFGQYIVWAGIIGTLELVAIASAVVAWQRNPSDKHHAMRVHIGLLIGALLGASLHPMLDLL